MRPLRPVFAYLAIVATVAMAAPGCRFDQTGIPGVAKDAAVGVDVDAVTPDAGPTPVGLGDGSDGDYEVSSASEVVNTYTTLAADVVAGADRVHITSTEALAAGDVVLLWQTTRVLDFTPVSGSTAPIVLAELGVGAWELTRVVDVTGNVVHVAPALANSYEAVGAQVVRVPQYRSLTIPAGSGITAKPWDGATGGVVAVLVAGVVDNAGSVDVDGLGFRGGAGNDAGDSDRGEGMVPGDWNADEPRRNMANAGGGGANHNAGGGGGGHMNTGGVGSADYNGQLDTGGMGGVAVIYDPTRYWMFGGGGGSGHENNNVAGGGGAGGGVIYIRAAVVKGDGRYVARGGDGLSLGNDGSGGGAAGGLIYIRAVDGLGCGVADASGGSGGYGQGRHGCGGGGSPGRVELPTTGARACEARALWGVAGERMNPSPFGPCHGATPCCGDGDLAGDEACDDGNRDDDDGCSGGCSVETR